MSERLAFDAFRRLLSRIRTVMSVGGDSETRLNRMVDLIAEELAADVCSVYVRRAGEVLELFATHGLRSSAIHVTRLRFGEGLIGEVAASARPLAIADVHHHPAFAYRPETGEDRFLSMLGVPVLGRGRVLGVLAIQTADRRQYREEQVEILQTVAMVVAELVASGELVSRDELTPTEGIAVKPMRLEGVGLTAGAGIGVAVIHSDNVVIHRFLADDAAVEHERLRQAVNEMHGTLDAILDDAVARDAADYRDVLETYRMIATDVGWLRRIGDAIDSGLTAEAAVRKVADDIRSRMNQCSEPYLRDRISDFEDLANRLLRHLVGDQAAPPRHDDVVLVARSMGPTELLNYDRERLRGLVLEEGGPTAHVAIIARALNIPAIGQVRDALRRIDDGDPVVVDADHGQAFVRPGDDIRQVFVNAIAAREARFAGYAAERDLPAVTRDGTRIEVHINAGLLVDMTSLSEYGADGVGLYRTEVPFMVRPDLPDLDSQVTLYRRVLDYAGDRPVVFRTLDVGGDKVLPYWRSVTEVNPAMGWRAIRIAHDRPAMLRLKLRAMVRAAAGRALQVMFPMLSLVSEYRQARRLIEMELEREAARGRPLPTALKVGAMLEVPALLHQLDALLAAADFVAIGSNDLLQFLFASDRGNARVAGRYDPLSPVVLRVIRQIVREGDAAGVPVSLCGEMAASPLAALALVGLGLRRISVPPSNLGPIKTMIRSIPLRSLENYLELFYDGSEQSIRPALVAYARDHDVVL